MNVVHLDEYRKGSDSYNNFGRMVAPEKSEQLDVTELLSCVEHMRKEAVKAGYVEMADMLALAYVSGKDEYDSHKKGRE